MSNPRRFSTGINSITSQGPYRILVANFSQPTVGVSPGVKTRYEFTFSPTFALAGSKIVGFESGRLFGGGNYASSSGAFTVASNDFTTGRGKISVGPFQFESGFHFQVGSSAGDTATNIAAAINEKTGYSAVAAGAVVTIEGPTGPGPYLFKAQSFGTVANFMITASQGDFLVPGGVDYSADVITGTV